MNYTIPRRQYAFIKIDCFYLHSSGKTLTQRLENQVEALRDLRG